MAKLNEFVDILINKFLVSLEDSLEEPQSVPLSRNCQIIKNRYKPTNAIFTVFHSLY